MTRRFETVLMIVLLLSCLPAVVVAMSSADGAPEAFHPTITEVKGQVEVKSIKYPVWEEVQEGMLLLTGDILRTEKGGFARIEFASGIIELYETTVMVIPSIGIQERKKDIQEVIIEEGKTLFDINPFGVERGFEFRTKNIQGGVKGTLFTVSYLNGGTAVNVYRGVVEISDLQASRETQVKLTAGKAVRVEKRTDFRAVQKFDPELAIGNYSNNIPPGLDGKGFPADDNANPGNKGVRKRGTGESGSSDDSSEVDSGDDSDNDQGDNDQVDD